MLRRQLNLIQWLALFLLFLGISLVQLENMTSTIPKQDVHAVSGFLSVVSACKFDSIEFNLKNLQINSRHIKWLSWCLF